MMHQRGLNSLILLTSVLCLSPWPTEAKTFYSHLGLVCLDECQPRGSNTSHQCTVRKLDGTEDLQHCSPRKGVDHRGLGCTSGCIKRGNGYHQCNTASGWGYCGEVMEYLRYLTSTYGVMCTDACAKRGEDYYWCHSSKGWDYCSPRENHDYKGNACQRSFPCDWRGEDYNWCYLQKGGWGKCGRVEPMAMVHIASNNGVCFDDCQWRGSYFGCETLDKVTLGICSPFPDYVDPEEPCRSDHMCGQHYGPGTNYWCYDTKSYKTPCGVVLPGECRYSLPKTDPPQVVCSRVDSVGSKIVTTFTAVVDHNKIADGRRYLQQAYDFIMRWDGRGLKDQVNSILITSEHLRLSVEGIFRPIEKSYGYYIFKIHANTQFSNGNRNKLAEIEVPVRAPLEYIRLALRESFHRRARVSAVQKTTHKLYKN